jgi:hypothetical protein
VSRKGKLVAVSAGTLSATRVVQGEVVVTGDIDGQAWVATLPSEVTAEYFMQWCRSDCPIPIYGVRNERVEAD